MRRVLLTTCFLLLIAVCYAQQSPAVIDSFKKQLSNARTVEARFDALSRLTRTLMNVSQAEADKYGQMLSREAELSRDRALMVKALLVHGERYSYFMGKREPMERSINYYNQALEMARSNKLDREMAQAYLGLSSVHMYVPALDKSLNYTTQASSIASALKDDSLSVAVYNSFGNVYQVKQDRLLALRNFLTALRLSEELKPGKNGEGPKQSLLRSCYRNLSQFYAGIKEYDKAIDYATRAYDQLNFIKTGNVHYTRAIDLNNMGNLYALKKNSDMAVYYYERSLKLADSLKFEALKMPAYTSILNQYINDHQPEKALAYFNENPGLKQYLSTLGFSHVIDQAYGIIYSDIGRYDSATFYFKKAEPQFEALSTPANRLNFYYQYAQFFRKSGNNAGAINYYNKAIGLAQASGDLESQKTIAAQLDSVYTRSGDYRMSYQYSTLYHKLKDSLQKLSEEKDLMQMELADEQQRQDRIAREKAEALAKKHNLQYMGITVAIAGVFLLLVLLGIFQVSATTIRILGFFAFIFLFEFIILIADHRIHEWTHGEPLKVLAIKIVLIAILLPLHHWLEHKVVSYLASRKLIIASRRGFWNNILAKRKTAAPVKETTFAQNHES
jgi:tetratricopeptide (TPR) repeat protein